MKYLALFLHCLILSFVTSNLLAPVGELVEPVVEGVVDTVGEIIGTAGESQNPIYTGVIETPANQFIRDIIGPEDEDDLESTRERIRIAGEELGIIVEDNEEDVTNEDNFVYPCPDLQDLDCIRDFLFENSECERVYGTVPDVNLLQLTIFLNSINITLSVSELQTEGFGGTEVIGFYYNKVTNNVVLTTQVTLKVTVPRVYVSYQRPGKESIVKSDFAGGEFEGLIFTTILRKLWNLRLDTAEIHTYVPQSLVKFIIGPKALISLNPEVITGVTALLASIPGVLQDTFQFQGQFAAVHIIQNLLCDFGYVLVTA